MSTGTRLTAEQCSETIQLLALHGALIAELPLEQLAREYVRWDSLGAILQPTAYRDTITTKDDQERLVHAALSFQREVIAIRERRR